MGDAGWIGREIDGRYVVEAVLGAGGMGLVLRARHAFTGAAVAIKVLRAELALDPEIQARFLAEARAGNAIGHPAVVTVLDAGQMPDGPLYLVMELLVGRPLRVAMARSELSQHDVRRIMRELCDVLGAAHARGVVHRDLKPENVFLVAPASTVKLLDFGIAKLLGGAADGVRTATGAMLGTPAYMAPEQLFDPSRVDARADLWAAGVMLFEMLSGRLPFAAATSAELLAALASARPDSILRYLPAAPPALELLLARALAREPAERFATAAELARAIDATDFGTAVAGAPGSTPTVMTGAAALPAAPPTAPAAPPAPSTTGLAHRGRWIGGAFALLALIVSASIAVGRLRQRGGVPDESNGARVPIDAAPDRDTWAAPTPTPSSSSSSDAQRLRQAACTDDCARVAGCGMAYDGCVGDCVTNVFTRRCVAMTTCREVATCSLAISCKGSAPTGQHGCAQTVACLGRCAQGPGQTACNCACYAQLAPAHAVEVVRIVACAARCNQDPACVRRTCGTVIKACH